MTNKQTIDGVSRELLSDFLEYSVPGPLSDDAMWYADKQALRALLVAPAEQKPRGEAVDLQHMAVSEGGKLRWMTGRKMQDCELYAMPDGSAIRTKLYAEQPQGEVERLKAENEALRKDAERYLWIKSQAELDSYGGSDWCLPVVHAWDYKPGSQLNEQFYNLDAAIDDAMSKGD